MTLPAASVRRFALACALFLTGTAVFAAAYCQAPLVYSNQNQYFLHGLADAGVGLLRADWLAQTRDPTPVFSALVTVTARFLPPATFHVYYALLLGACAAALFGLFAFLAGKDVFARRWPVFVALLVLVHAALPRWCSYRWLGQDYPWFLQAGVAGQYVLGPVFQPSAFGALLVGAVCLFVRGRPFLAAACTALAATVHTTYLLPAGLLTLGFVWSLYAEGQSRQALAVAALAFALVLPAGVHVLVAFGPTTHAAFTEAQVILVNVRIPHHTRPELWFDPVAGFQIGWMVLALVLVRRTRLFAVLGVPFLLGVLLTLAQIVTGSTTLALLFPWRISAVLMPVATAVVLARLVAVLGPRLDGLPARALAVAVVAFLVGGGLWISANRLGFSTSDEERPLFNFVRRNKKSGDVYFVPVRVPALAKSTHGSLSSDFKPAPDKQRDARVIPYDLQRFRLMTGAPIYVDFKAVPYRDVEVLEWYERLRAAASILEDLEHGRLATALVDLRRRGVTHLVLDRGRYPHELRGTGLQRVYEDEYYRLYRLKS